MEKYLFILLVVSSLLISCSDNAVDSTQEEIKAKVRHEKLLLFNISDKVIYYFAVDSDLAMSINWAPVSNEDNVINPFEMIEIPLANVTGYGTTNYISIYYWSEKNPAPNDIKGISIGEQ